MLQQSCLHRANTTDRQHFSIESKLCSSNRLADACRQNITLSLDENLIQRERRAKETLFVTLATERLYQG